MKGPASRRPSTASPHPIAGMTRKQSRPQLSAKITFRLDPQTFHKLEKLGKAHGLTAHGMARQLTEDALEQTDVDRLRLDLEAYHQEQLTRFTEAVGQIGQLRIDLATAVEAMLLQTSEESPEEIRQWVIANLLEKDLPPESEFPES